MHRRWASRTSASRLHLSELRPEQSAALVEAMLQATMLPAALQQLIARKAEGNPFFIEEVTTALLERGVLQQRDGSYVLARPVEQIHIPNTVQEVILSRIDRLEREAKDALQLASVIGREFTARLLGRISDVQTQLDGTLQELKALELIFQKAYFPELAYMFKHALTHDVAYSRCCWSGARRCIASWQRPSRSCMPTGSRRIRDAGLPLRAGEAWPKALQYLDLAGEKATAAYANQDALEFYAQALDVSTRLGETALATSAVVARKRGLVNLGVSNFPAAIVDFECSLSTAPGLRDRHLEGSVLAVRGFAEIIFHRFEAARRRCAPR